MTTMRKALLTLGFAGALAAGVAGASSAAPLSQSAGLKAYNPDVATQVRWRGRGGWGPGIGAGIAAGIIGSAAWAAGAPYYGPGPYYYEEPYAYYGPPAYYDRRYYHGRPYYRHYRHRHWR